jgi:Rrf2 family protein
LLSNRGRYALKALTYLARSEGDEAVQSGLIAETEGMPRKFLEAILTDLKRARLVESTRGSRGGYRLARPPAEITFGDIIRATDGPLALVPCVSKLFYRRCDDCHDENLCAVRKIMAGVRDEVAGILDNTTLADAATLADQLRDDGGQIAA